MIKFIYDNRITQLFTLVLGVLMIRLLLFQFQISAEYVSEQRGIFRYFIENINGYQWLSFWLSSALIVFQGLLLGQLISEYNVIDRPGYSILFFYGLLTSLFGGNLLLSYVIIGGVFFLTGLWFLYRYLKGQYKRLDLFVASLFMGLSALSVPELFWSMVFLLVIVLMFKATEAGEVLVIVFGILIPYYLISSVGYLASTDLNFKSTLQLWNMNIRRADWDDFTVPGLDWIVVANLILVALFGVFKVFGSYYRYNVDARRSRLAMGFIAIFILLIYVLKYAYYREYFVFLSIPLSIYTANLFQMEKSSVLSRLLFYAFVLGIIAYSFR